MVVGDADQSIYAFRGANIRNILDFEKDFPDATSILLEQNYRSTQTILNAANSVIGNNRGRKPRSVSGPTPATATRIVGYVADDEHDEARFVSEEIDRLTDARDAKPSDVAVFYRTNAQSRVFEEVFIRVGMPYKVVGGVRFYERREIRDALAYLRMLVNSADEISLRRVLNTPRRGIGDRAEACVAGARRAGADHLLGGADPRRRGARPRDPVPARDPGLRGSGRGAPVDGRRGGAGRRDRGVRARAHRLPRRARGVRRPAGRHPGGEPRRAGGRGPGVLRRPGGRPVRRPRPTWTPARSRPGSADFLERVALVADSDQIPDAPEGEDAGVVTLMTLHTAKGLEFPVVFLTGLEDGVFPHSRSLGDQPELEEERRLAYVGVTRAQRRLYVSRAMVRSAWGAPAAQPGLPLPQRAAGRPRRLAAHRGRPDLVGAPGLVEPVTRRVRRLGQPTAAGRRNFSSAALRADAAAKAKPAREIPSLEPGDRVVHDSFGLGTVVAVEGVADKTVASIDFGSEGVKRLLLRYAPVEKL